LCWHIIPNHPAQGLHCEQTTETGIVPITYSQSTIVALDHRDLTGRRHLLIATSAIGGATLVATTFPFLDSMEPSDKARAEGGPIEVDISTLQPGELRTVVWRSKPVWVLNRDAQMLQSLQSDINLLSDPESKKSEQPDSCRNADRSIEPGLAVIVAVCTHLGCTPIMHGRSEAGTGSLDSKWPGGFYCPCHGSKFDLAGRVFKNVPAPINLEIPPYQYISPTRIRIGKAES
jgi:ubiquinol-cytochrome c reductase iron-sulfur subunit